MMLGNEEGRCKAIHRQAPPGRQVARPRAREARRGGHRLRRGAEDARRRDVREHVRRAGHRPRRTADRASRSASRSSTSASRKNPKEKIALINPEIIQPKASRSRKRAASACPRSAKRSSAPPGSRSAQDVNGEWFEVEGEELLARALQHEIDHLDGVLFIDRISRLKRELVLRKIRKMQKNGEW